jgi:hypothetical protein
MIGVKPNFVIVAFGYSIIAGDEILRLTTGVSNVIYENFLVIDIS